MPELTEDGLKRRRNSKSVTSPPSQIKYVLALRVSPSGTVPTMSPSSTFHRADSPVQPLRSLPLKSDTNPSGSDLGAAAARAGAVAGPAAPRGAARAWAAAPPL